MSKINGCARKYTTMFTPQESISLIRVWGSMVVQKHIAIHGNLDIRPTIITKAEWEIVSDEMIKQGFERRELKQLRSKLSNLRTLCNDISRKFRDEDRACSKDLSPLHLIYWEEFNKVFPNLLPVKDENDESSEEEVDSDDPAEAQDWMSGSIMLETDSLLDSREVGKMSEEAEDLVDTTFALTDTSEDENGGEEMEQKENEVSHDDDLTIFEDMDDADYSSAYFLSDDEDLSYTVYIAESPPDASQTTSECQNANQKNVHGVVDNSDKAMDKNLLEQLLKSSKDLVNLQGKKLKVQVELKNETVKFYNTCTEYMKKSMNPPTSTNSNFPILHTKKSYASFVNQKRRLAQKKQNSKNKYAACNGLLKDQAPSTSIIEVPEETPVPLFYFVEQLRDTELAELEPNGHFLAELDPKTTDIDETCAATTETQSASMVPEVRESPITQHGELVLDPTTSEQSVSSLESEGSNENAKMKTVGAAFHQNYTPKTPVILDKVFLYNLLRKTTKLQKPPSSSSSTSGCTISVPLAPEPNIGSLTKFKSSSCYKQTADFNQEPPEKRGKYVELK